MASHDGILFELSVQETQFKPFELFGSRENWQEIGKLVKNCGFGLKFKK